MEHEGGETSGYCKYKDRIHGLIFMTFALLSQLQAFSDILFHDRLQWSLKCSKERISVTISIGLLLV